MSKNRRRTGVIECSFKACLCRLPITIVLCLNNGNQTQRHCFFISFEQYTLIMLMASIIFVHTCNVIESSYHWFDSWCCTRLGFSTNNYERCPRFLVDMDMLKVPGPPLDLWAKLPRSETRRLRVDHMKCKQTYIDVGDNATFVTIGRKFCDRRLVDERRSSSEKRDEDPKNLSHPK